MEGSENPCVSFCEKLKSREYGVAFCGCAKEATDR